MSALADLTSKAYCQRKRAEGQGHKQALLALARRRVNVLEAIFRAAPEDRLPYDALVPLERRHVAATATAPQVCTAVARPIANQLVSRAEL
ncbi:hypothetical protein [Streptomyces sp. NPDC007205]|uniref:hypothetical protein n=1 Tax=Streptomyces sp. NPDC007205 TaxID=3154316 RepID=UPI00340CDF9C